MTAMSDTTLLRPATVAALALVSKPTIYAWLTRGLVSPSYEVEGEPVFTREHAHEVVRLAQSRRMLQAAIRLPREDEV